ncbi:type I restriction enzyme M protein [Flavobacterium omnivorum]|uniref:site-specific DNA-methyltransferase (adenine-specific) n=1 Tax=Flavobacterium omnivorum TaxID=178355 RepID=A0A1G8H5L5_9FLAO|nr:N-6 DNA methylase [Flavobacterium omnivorum]SDI01903.1 type I restriction enzyme M protein [Flavobacterium omnivorum]
MREQNFNIKEVNEISNQVWGIFDILRGSISTEDFIVIFFFLSAHKDNLLVEARNSEYIGDINYDVIDCIYRNDNYKRLIEVYGPIIKSMPSQKLEQILDFLIGLNQNEIKEHFSEIFDNLLYRFSAAQGKSSGEFIQPVEISRFIMNLADLPDNATVYNPFAGLASFGTFLNKSQRYYGQEINPRTWALGKLRLMAHELDDSNFSLDDSIEHWNNFGEFDLIVSTPPFGMKIPNHLSNENGLTLERYIIERSLNRLPKNGKLICVVSQGFLFRGGKEQRFREELVKNGLIDTIISLPSGLLKHTGIPTCIVVFKKSQSHNGFIRIVNANDFVISKGPRDKRLEDIKLSKMIAQDSENEFVKFVSIDKICNADYNLNVQRYFAKEFHGVVLVPEIAEFFRGTSASKGEYGKFIRIRDLKDDVVDCILNLESIEKKELHLHGIRKIEESCLLLATRWKTLKPTFFEFEGEPIYIANDIIALKIDETKVDIYYLINELHADYVGEQMGSYRTTGVIPIIKKEDLFNVRIQLLSIQEQKAKVSGILELSEQIKKLQRDKEQILKGIDKQEVESSTSLSHILGKPLLSIGSSLDIIQDALAKVDINWKQVMVSERKKFTLEDAFTSISKNLDFIQSLVDENKSIINISHFEITDINLLTFIKNYTKNASNSSKDNVQIILDIHNDVLEQFGKKIMVNANEQKLTMVLNNIIDNAKHHGFLDTNKNYKISIELVPFTETVEVAEKLNYDILESESYIEVKISNNGKPSPKDFKLEDYIRKNFGAGNTKNKGLGGYEINEIIKSHNNGRKALNIFSADVDSEYNTTISFLLPIIQIN